MIEFLFQAVRPGIKHPENTSIVVFELSSCNCHAGNLNKGM